LLRIRAVRVRTSVLEMALGLVFAAMDTIDTGGSQFVLENWSIL